MNRIEVLAPAGSRESLYAAINNGADAVYLGGSKFSARAYASNFDNDEMIKAVDYAHYYGVRVFVTINTLLKEEELKEALKYAGFLYEIGVDALIIQDLGLFNLIKAKFPSFELHASTQMTIHNGEGALYYKEKGFHRLVLSRELSFDEIRYISKELGIETEIFVHGALCICYSGQCLMSSMIGGRSGNRGKCAQPCRLPYTLKGEKGGEREGYLLSPKDTCTIDEVNEIIKSETYSLKIEGRMKKPEYVAGVVSNYRKAVDDILNKEFKYNAEKGKKELLKLFNREGFSKAYFKKNVGSDMMSYNFPKNTGILLGKVLPSGEILLKEEIALGDGVRQESEKGFTVSKITKNGNEVKKAYIGEKVKLFPITYKKGQILYRTSDKEFLSILEESVKQYKLKLPLDVSGSFKVGENFTLKCIYKGEEYSVSGDMVEVASKKPLEKERIEEALRKTGDVPFKISNIEFESFEDGFLRISSLNTLRRELVEEIMKGIRRHYRRARNEEYNEVIEKSTAPVSEYIYSCIKKEQLDALMTIDGEKHIAFDIFSREEGALKLKDILDYSNIEGLNIYIKTPNIIKSEFNKVKAIIDKALPYIKGILTSHLGVVYEYKNKTKLIGDYKLNIINSKSLAFYSEDFHLPTLSLELNKKEIKRVLENSRVNCANMIYGKTELMISEYCPIGSTFGGKNSSKECNLACTKDKYTLIDRFNEGFRVMTDIFCRSYILNGKPLNLIDERDELRELGVKAFRLEFRDESFEEVLEVLNKLYYNEELKGEFTKGHYRRGIE
ncbi:MAG: DUF3656 domain-containing U32 family peptidase [Clostridium sp.]